MCFSSFFVGTFFSWFCLRCGPNYFLHVKPLAITIKGRGRRDGKEEQTKGRVARRVVGQERPQVLADGVLYYMYAKHTDSVSHMYMHQGCSNLSFSDISGYSIFFIILKHFCVFRVIFLSSVTNVTALMGHIFQGCDQITHFLYFLPYLVWHSLLTLSVCREKYFTAFYLAKFMKILMNAHIIHTSASQT